MSNPATPTPRMLSLPSDIITAMDTALSIIPAEYRRLILIHCSRNPLTRKVNGIPV